MASVDIHEAVLMLQAVQNALLMNASVERLVHKYVISSPEDKLQFWEEAQYITMRQKHSALQLDQKIKNRTYSNCSYQQLKALLAEVVQRNGDLMFGVFHDRRTIVYKDLYRHSWEATPTCPVHEIKRDFPDLLDKQTESLIVPDLCEIILDRCMLSIDTISGEIHKQLQERQQRQDNSSQHILSKTRVTAPDSVTLSSVTGQLFQAPTFDKRELTQGYGVVNNGFVPSFGPPTAGLAASTTGSNGTGPAQGTDVLMATVPVVTVSSLKGSISTTTSSTKATNGTISGSRATISTTASSSKPISWNIPSSSKATSSTSKARSRPVNWKTRSSSIATDTTSMLGSMKPQTNKKATPAVPGKPFSYLKRELGKLQNTPRISVTAGSRTSHIERKAHSVLSEAQQALKRELEAKRQRMVTKLYSMPGGNGGKLSQYKIPLKHGVRPSVNNGSGRPAGNKRRAVTAVHPSIRGSSVRLDGNKRPHDTAIQPPAKGCSGRLAGNKRCADTAIHPSVRAKRARTMSAKRSSSVPVSAQVSTQNASVTSNTDRGDNCVSVGNQSSLVAKLSCKSTSWSVDTGEDSTQPLGQGRSN